MATETNDILTELQTRGLVAQVTDEAAVRDLFKAGGVVFYNGYDPTGPSLHVGHLVTLMVCKHLERSGHRPLALLGGGTARVGDPSGKTEMRQLIDGEQIEANLAGLRAQIGRFLDVAGGKTQVVNNADWLLKLNYVDFLRDIGRHFSVNRMLTAEAYKSRLERGLSFIEFNYQLLQAYDFAELNRRHGCVLQLGGDDQWGNIVAGVDLCRRVNQKTVHGLTFPLLTTATGAKMGKTAQGAVWLDPTQVAPFEYYQYWVNVHDDDTVKMLKIFTFLPVEEIVRLGTLQGAELNMAKSILAYEATAVWHGKAAADEAHAAAQGAFGGRALPAEMLPTSTVPRGASANEAAMPTTELTPSALEPGKPLVDLLVEAGMAPSKKEARRLIEQGAVRVNDVAVQDAAHVITAKLFDDGPAVVRAGKKRVHRLVLATK